MLVCERIFSLSLPVSELLYYKTFRSKYYYYYYTTTTSVYVV